MKKIYYSWQDVNGAVLELARVISVSGWRPDYIVGLTRGGLTPAVMLSQYLEIPMHTLKVSLRDNDNDQESNLWMAEDAFGYQMSTDTSPASADIYRKKDILIVDDINDTGATINWIKKDWRSGCLPNDSSWDSVWHNNVRFAVLTNNLASAADVDYNAWEVNKAEEDCWLVYPWETFWR